MYCIINTAWFTTVDKRVIARANFIFLVSEEYWHQFAAELCRVLSIIEYIDSILSRTPNLTTKFSVEIGSDYSSILD